MKISSIVGTSLVLVCLLMLSGCAGCNDEFATGCTSDDDCRVGRMCIEEACAPARDTGIPLGDEDGGDDRPDRPDAWSGTDGSATPVTPSDSMVEEYCDMEASCIPICLSGTGEADCDSSQRQTECRQDFEDWYESKTSQSTRCAQTIDSWVECISAASCGEVEEFFQAHPDGVTEDTACGAEYFKMECVDFEPVTEYGFSR